jgi:hypothetical protein
MEWPRKREENFRVIATATGNVPTPFRKQLPLGVVTILLKLKLQPSTAAGTNC